MELLLLVLIGLGIGALGTLIGAGGGFLLVPILILWHPEWSVEQITAISMAVVACNAISGSIAYMRDERIDYKAGWLFAISTIPGSILGVWVTHYIARGAFDLVFAGLLLLLGAYLFIKGGKPKPVESISSTKKGMVQSQIIDKSGTVYNYQYNKNNGVVLSVIVGFVSPILGIGGGIIHVPAMVEWLNFPVHVATATSHFVLAIMATITVIVHYFEGSYENSTVLYTIMGLIIGIIPGAQFGAFLSHKLKARVIIRALAIALILVGIRILTRLI